MNLKPNDLNEASLEYLKRQWQVMDNCKNYILQSTTILITLCLGTSALFITNDLDIEFGKAIFISIQVLCAMAGHGNILIVNQRFASASNKADDILKEFNFGCLVEPRNSEVSEIKFFGNLFLLSRGVVTMGPIVCASAVFFKATH